MRPCPFCGNAESLEICDNDYGDLHVWCRKCDASGPPVKTDAANKKMEAERLWELRFSVEVSASTLEALDTLDTRLKTVEAWIEHEDTKALEASEW